MPANLAIDDRLLQEAFKAGGHSTHWETVNAALREYVERRQQPRILEIFGSIDFDETYEVTKPRDCRP